MNRRTAIVGSVFKALLFLLILGVCTCYVDRTLKDKNNYLKYSLFYKEEESFDVLFFGSSRMLNAVFPVELWTDFGITSYNMAQHGEGTNVTYWQMKNAFQHNRPKVAVVDLSLVRADRIEDENEKSKSYLHKSVDHMPFGLLKYEALRSVTEDVDLLEYLFPLTIYHNRWNDLDRNDFYLVPSGTKGAEMRASIEVLPEMEWSSDEKAKWVDVENTGLQDMIDLCREYKVELVFTCMPSLWVKGNPSVCALMNSLEEYAGENGVPFLDFAKEDDMINYAVDFHDTSHVNPSGGKKITHSLGEFLTEHYIFPEKTENTSKAWAEAVVNYKWVKKLELDAAENAEAADCYLMLLNDDDYTVTIRMRDITVIESYGIAAVLEELNIDESEIAFDPKEGNLEIEGYDSRTGDLMHCAVFTR